MNCCPGMRTFLGFCTGVFLAGGLFVAISQMPSALAKDDAKLLRHVVMFKFKDAATEADVKKVVDAFRELPSKIPAVAEFEYGTNNSPEGLADGFTHCFFITFKTEKDRETYLPHPAHSAFVEVLKPHLDKALVVDYWAGK
jgi:Stress responsive A/B Barrel Domain